MNDYLRTNYHTHTKRCHHAVGEDREYVEAAIAQGIEVLGFSDHIPVSIQNDVIQRVRMTYAEVEDYFDSILKLKKEYKDDIEILVGFEGEYFPEEFENQMKRLSDYPYDYLILGQHFLQVDGEIVYSGWGTDSEAVLDKYISSCIEALSTGVYSYLAHPDLINFSGDEKVWTSQMKRLLTFCKENHYPVEYNLLGALDDRPYPSDRCFSLIGELQNEVILGIDAHAPAQIGDRRAFAKAENFIEKYHLNLIDCIKGVAD